MYCRFAGLIFERVMRNEHGWTSQNPALNLEITRYVFHRSGYLLSLPAVIPARMKRRELFIICLLLALAVVCFFVGYRQGWQAQKKESTQFIIRRSLRVLHEAEHGDIASITNGCRMYLLGHTKTYEDLFGTSDIPDSFRASFAEARRIARDVQTNLVVFDPKSLDE